jgi:anti-sigma factor RsiW
MSFVFARPDQVAAGAPAQRPVGLAAPACCDRLLDSAVYVLGALPAVECANYRAHLIGCAVCRAEVARLGHLPALLARIAAPTARRTPPWTGVGDPPDGAR